MKIKNLCNKAVILESKNFAVLISYETIVLIYDKQNEIFYKLDKFYKKDFYGNLQTVTKSRTTTKHINCFIDFYNLSTIWECKSKIITVTEDFIKNIDLNISITDIAKIK